MTDQSWHDPSAPVCTCGHVKSAHYAGEFVCAPIYCPCIRFVK